MLIYNYRKEEQKKFNSGRSRGKVEIMKTIEIYKNYGVLAAEKRNVYTFGAPHATATCSDKITVVVPEGWTIYQNQSGQTMVTAPWGWDYEINEVLHGNEKPCFYALDKNMKGHRVYLEEV